MRAVFPLNPSKLCSPPPELSRIFFFTVSFVIQVESDSYSLLFISSSFFFLSEEEYDLPTLPDFNYNRNLEQ